MKIHKKGIIFGAIGGIATLAGAIVLAINGQKIGFDNGVDWTLNRMKQYDPQMYEDFCEGANVAYLPE